MNKSSLMIVKSNDHNVIVAGDSSGNASRVDTTAKFLHICEATDFEDGLFLARIRCYERRTV
ncbi:hypothetical protein [Allohahella sp. A8]|uniref:hypothetical protein n=1 Tax=Allohahella sp. A8 TaxID=3141461 RepID=UPI003A802855